MHPHIKNIVNLIKKYERGILFVTGTYALAWFFGQGSKDNPAFIKEYEILTTNDFYFYLGVFVLWQTIYRAKNFRFFSKDQNEWSADVDKRIDLLEKKLDKLTGFSKKLD